MPRLEIRPSGKDPRGYFSSAGKGGGVEQRGVRANATNTRKQGWYTSVTWYTLVTRRCQARRQKRVRYYGTAISARGVQLARGLKMPRDCQNLWRGGSPSSLRNLKKAQARTNPRLAALGRGRIQHRVALGFAINDWNPITARHVLETVFVHRLLIEGKKLDASHYQRVRHAFERIAVRSHRLTTRGRPWVWKLKPEIAADPETWWRKHKHPFRRDWSA
jgi:hypothetical protein